MKNREMSEGFRHSRPSTDWSKKTGVYSFAEAPAEKLTDEEIQARIDEEVQGRR